MNSDNIAYKLFSRLGYNVESIPTSDNTQKKEADFLICYDNIVAIIEAKLKEDDLELSLGKEAKLASGGVSVIEGKLGRNETISGVIEKAKKQVLSSSDKEHDFKIISFIASGSNAKTKADQFKNTIYGSTAIIEGNTQKTCYFYRNADFFRKKIIDAAVVSHIFSNEITTQLCLNPYSNNYDLLRISSFIRPFGEAVIDPFELERQGLLYIPDSHVERKLKNVHKLSPLYNPILQNLTVKYKTGFIIAADFNSPELSIRSLSLTDAQLG